MKQNDAKKKLNEVIDLLSENNYSSHFVVMDGKEPILIGGNGSLEDIVQGYIQMFTDAMEEDAPESLKVLCTTLIEIVLQYQKLGIESLFNIHDEDDEDCEHCDRLHECMNPAAVEKRKELGMVKSQARNIDINWRLWTSRTT